MKLLKTAGVLLVVVAALLASVRWWGGCDVNYQLCRVGCSVRHFDADMKAAGCKTDCASRKVRCLADEGVKGVNDFLEGMQGR